MSLLAAVTPRDQPLTGVKRSLPSNPTTVPKNLPAFRGRGVGPGAAVKAPKLRQGNRDNEGTNVCVPYNRVMPLEFLSHYCGRVAPGDVAFLDKFHPGYVNAQPVNIGSAGTATMHRVLGVDGVNRMLHGATAPHGWVYKADAHSGIDTNLLAAMSASQVINTRPPDPTKKDDPLLGAFALTALERYRMDGVVKSNDQPMNLTSNGARDATIFNIAVQGPTLVNNGYLAYDESPNGTTTHSKTGRSRTVEAYPRGSQQASNHVTTLGRVGSPWAAPGMYDFVAAFTGQYTPYPMQMFDRQVTTLDHIYVGLRAYELKGWDTAVPDNAATVKAAIAAQQTTVNNASPSDKAAAQATLKTMVDDLPRLLALRADYDAVAKTIDGITGLDSADKTAMKTKGRLNDGRKLFFFQYLPMSSHKAMLLDLKDRLENGPQTDRKNRELEMLKRTHALHGKPHATAGKFDEEDYDAIRKDDLKNMVGAWHVGRVLDTRAARHATYEQGPGDTGFMLNVDVHIEWHNALPQKAANGAGGSNTYEEMMRNWSNILYTSAYAQQRSRGKKGDASVDAKALEWKTACIQRGVDTGRSVRQSLQQKLGRLVGIDTMAAGKSGVQNEQFLLGRIANVTPSQLSTAPWRAVSREAVAAVWSTLGYSSADSPSRADVVQEITNNVTYVKDNLLLKSTTALTKNLPQKPTISLGDLQKLLSGPLGTAAPLEPDDPLHAAWMDLAAHRDDDEPMQVELGASAAATAAATAAAASAPTGGDSSLGSSWASLDSGPEPTTAAAAPAPEPMAVEAPAPTPVISAAAAALAPVAHAAIDAAKQARAAKAKGKSKSPVRQKPTPAATAATTAAAPVASLLDAPVPPVAPQPTPTPTPAPAPAAASASTGTVSDLSLLGAAASKPAPQRRPRDTPSMTDSYFAFLDKDKAPAPTSPTPSHGSDKSSESGGPKTFQRRPR